MAALALFDSAKVASLGLNALKKPFRSVEAFLGKCLGDTPVFLSIRDGRLEWRATKGRLIIAASTDLAVEPSDLQPAALCIGDVQLAFRKLGNTYQRVTIHNEADKILIAGDEGVQSIFINAVGEPDFPDLQLTGDVVVVKGGYHRQQVRDITEGAKGKPVELKVVDAGKRVQLSCDGASSPKRATFTPLMKSPISIASLTTLRKVCGSAPKGTDDDDT